MWVLMLYFVVIFLQACFGDGGTKVLLKNVDDKPLRSVFLHVTGNSYELGELDPGETRALKVYPTGESHIEIEHLDLDGEKKRLLVDCYIEPRSGGTVKIEVNNDSVVKTSHNRRF